MEVGCRKLGVSAQERTKQVSDIMYLSVFTYTVAIHFEGDPEVRHSFNNTFQAIPILILLCGLFFKAKVMNLCVLDKRWDKL